MPRRLGINLTFLNPQRTGGAETYTRALLDQYHRLDLAGLAGLDLPIVLFVGRHHELTVDPARFQLVECNIDPRHQYRRILWEQSHLPAILHKHNLDLVHFPYSAYPIRYRGRSVVTLHDTTRFISPQGVPKAQLYYRAAMESRLRTNGHHIVTVSHADAAIFRDHLRLPPSQLTTIYHGVSDTFRTNEPHTGPRPYLLWTGRPYDHKRLDTLLEAYCLLHEQQGGPVPPLRLIGIPTADQPPLRKRIRSIDASLQISLEPPVPHAQLPDLFRKAALFIFPSSYESFGLPALEAMAAGCPVLCSDLPVFQELFSPAASFFPVRDAPALAQSIAEILSNPEKQHAMQHAGLTHSAPFTWQRCAEQTLSLYHRLLS